MEDPKGVNEEILQFYKGLLGTSLDQKVDAKECLARVNQTRVPEHMISAWIQSVSTEETRLAMLSVKGDKSPGPDGFTSAFFYI